MAHVCLNCSSELDPNSNFCESCGASVQQNIVCPNCSNRINSGAKFCKFCAFDLTRSIYDSTSPSFLTEPKEQINKIHPGWITTGGIALALMIFVITGFSYYSGVKEELAKSEGKNQELQKQLDGKSQEVEQKSNEITNKTNEISNLSGTLEEREKKVEQQIGEIKSLKGSISNVSNCISGIFRSRSAYEKGNAFEAYEIIKGVESACKKSDDIIKKFDKFKD